METVLTPELIAAFNECLENNDPKTFGQLARMEIVFGKLYQEDKGEELGVVLEYIKNRGVAESGYESVKLNVQKVDSA